MTFDPMNRRQLAALATGGLALAATGPASAQRSQGGNATAPVAALTTGDWMAQVRAQHRGISRHFAMLRDTRDEQAAMRDVHLKQLATLLTGHSIAEEVVLYPGIAMKVDRAGSDRFYKEQQDAKVMVAEIDAMPRSGPNFLTRLAALETAINAHVAEEENDLYPRLMRSADARMNAKMTADFRREFTRYMT